MIEYMLVKCKGTETKKSTSFVSGVDNHTVEEGGMGMDQEVGEKAGSRWGRRKCSLGDAVLTGLL